MGADEHSPDAGSRPVAEGTLSKLLRDLAAAPPRDEWGAALRPGAVFGRFELVRELGRGGFGIVWEARDRELGRRVAFKAVRAAGPREIREDGLLHEAEAAARLTHPNIVTLHDVGRSEHGPFLVLELLEGATLARVLARRAVPLREAVGIAVQIARGLAHAHRRGVVHRDLKPENVFLCQEGQVKVLDFGLAHVFGRRKVGGGTRGYMAPEQLEGSPEDERTDVWALGAILFEMLAGRSAVADAGTGPAPGLDVRGAPGLGELVARMLAVRPVERPRDGGEVLASLTAIEQGLQRAPPSSTEVSVRTVPRNRLLIAGGAALVAASVAALAYLAAVGAPAQPRAARTTVAVADVVNETADRELNALSGLLVTSLEQSRRLRIVTPGRILDLAARTGGRDVSRVDEALGREVGRANGFDVLLLPAIRRVGATYAAELRAVDPVRDEHLFTVSDRATSKEALLDLLDRLSDAARARLRDDVAAIAQDRLRLASAMTRSLEAYQHYVAGREARFRDGMPAVALREYLRAIELDPTFAAAHAELGSAYANYGRADLAEPHWRVAADTMDALPQKERTLLRLRRAYLAPDAALWSREDALRLANDAVASHPEDESVLVAAAHAYMFFGDLERMEEVARQALELDPGAYFAAGFLTDHLAATAEALEIARRAVATRRTPMNLGLLAEALLAAGSDEEAGPVARELVRGDGRREVLILSVACSILYQLASDAECIPAWAELITGGVNALERDAARFEFARALAVQGRMREALQALRAAPATMGRNAVELPTLLSIGRDRLDAPRAVEEARRISSPQLRRNQLAFFGARRDAEETASALTGQGHPLAEQIFAAQRAAWEGRHAHAAELLRRVSDEVASRNFWGGQARAVGTQPFGVNLLRAESLFAAARFEEAARVWPPTLPCRCVDPVDRASNGLRLRLVRARAMARLGRYADAMRELDRTIAEWKDADPDLPLLVEAKTLRRRLAPGAAATGAPTPGVEEGTAPR